MVTTTGCNLFWQPVVVFIESVHRIKAGLLDFLYSATFRDGTRLHDLAQPHLRFLLMVEMTL